MEKPIYGVAMRQNGVFSAPTLYHFSPVNAEKDLTYIRDRVPDFDGKIIAEKKGIYGLEFTALYKHPHKKKTVDYFIVRAWVE